MTSKTSYTVESHSSTVLEKLNKWVATVLLLFQVCFIDMFQCLVLTFEC